MSEPAMGIIGRHEVLRLDQFAKRLGLGKPAIRAMRRAGLPVRYVGGKAWVSGQEFAEFIEGCPTQSPTIAKALAR